MSEPAARPWGLPDAAAEALGAASAGTGRSRAGPGRRGAGGAAAPAVVAAATVTAAAVGALLARLWRGRRVHEVGDLSALLVGAGMPSSSAVVLLVSASLNSSGHPALLRRAACTGPRLVACFLGCVPLAAAPRPAEQPPSAVSLWRARLAEARELTGAFLSSMVTPDAASAGPSGKAGLTMAWRRVESGDEANVYVAIRGGELAEVLCPSPGETGLREAEAFLRRHLPGGGARGGEGGGKGGGRNGGRRRRAPDGDGKGFRPVTRRPGCGASGGS